MIKKQINEMSYKMPKKAIRKNIIFFTMFLFLILIGFILVRTTKETTDLLAHQVLRFHVVANSDTTEDQLLKERVRDEVMGFMEPIIEECQSVDETKYVVEGTLNVIQQIAEEVVEDYGKNYEVYVTLDKANFPTKAYGDILLPAGEYEACRIIIGEGKGENWWCVMYPPLCYVDAASGVVPLEGKEQLEQELSSEQYKLVTSKEKKYQIKFKIVDAINSIFLKQDYKKKG